MKKLLSLALLSSSVYASEKSDEIVAALAAKGMLKSTPAEASHVVDGVLQAQSWIPSMSTILQALAVMFILIATSGWLSKLVKLGWLFFAAIPLVVYQTVSMGVLAYGLMWTTTQHFMFLPLAQFVIGLTMLGVCSWWSATHRTLVRQWLRRLPWSPTYNLQGYIAAFGAGMTWYTGSAWFLSLVGLVVLSALFVQPATAPKGLTDEAWSKLSLEQLFMGKRRLMDNAVVAAGVPLLLLYSLVDSTYFFVVNGVVMLALMVLTDVFWKNGDTNEKQVMLTLMVVPVLFTGMPWFVVMALVTPKVMRGGYHVVKYVKRLPWLVLCSFLGLLLLSLSWALQQQEVVSMLLLWKDTLWMYYNKAYYVHEGVDWFKAFSHY